MASVFKTGKRWRAQVARKGIRRSKLFDSRQEARDWAARQEWEILNRDQLAAEVTLASALDRYAREVSPAKKGHRWEAFRLAKMAADRIGKLAVRELRASDVADWRDRRLREVAPGSVRREMVLLSSALEIARKEWGLISENPCRDVRKPTEPPPRDRLPTEDEFERLAHVAGSDLTKATARAYHAFLFGCATAMRAGEIVGLTWDRIDLTSRVATLAVTKSGTSRDVPLSSEAVRLLQELPELDPVFGLSGQKLDALWRKVRGKAGIEGLNFHDSRAYATTTLARKVDVLTLARITGHRDLSMLQRYYRETAADLAKRLD